LGISEGILQRDKFNSEPLDGMGDTKERRRKRPNLLICVKAIEGKLRIEMYLEI
jgi:hypothetical protein